MIIGYKQMRGTFSPGVTVLEVIERLAPEEAKDALGCFCGGQVLELSTKIDTDSELYPITYQNEEGRRIYERSLRFVFLLAVRRCMPYAKVRFEHSAGYGVYLIFHNQRLTAADVRLLHDVMCDIVREDLPFSLSRWSRDKAIDYFAKEGQNDKTRLLSYRPYNFFNVYESGGMAEYFYGAMLPSTGYVKVFDTRLQTPGMVLKMPSPEAPDRPAPYVSRPKHLIAYSQSNDWCDVLGCRNAADLNDLIAQGRLRDFIRVNEALHDKSIAEIADDIMSRDARAVFVAGPSSSGKTTFSNRLCIHLRVLGLRPVLISLDDFYLDRDDIPLEADGKPDLEAITTLDLPLFHDCIQSLLDGRETKMPTFSFKHGKRRAETETMRITAQQPIVIEGIHALNPLLQEGFDKSMLYRIYISELTCLNLDDHNRIRTTDARLLRRVVRDYQFRGTKPVDTLAMWTSVRKGEEKWIFPYQELADVVFNSALHYELPLLKNIAYDMLKEISPDNPVFFRSRRLLKILHYLLPFPEEALKEIPPLSILREFIGGCTLYIE